MPQNPRREIQWATGGIGPDVILQNPWGWNQIQHLLDEVLLLTTDRETTDSPEGIEEMALQLYGFLPAGKDELRRIRKNGIRYFKSAAWGNKEAREILQPYRRKLRALVWAVRMKLGVIHCSPNQRDWDKRAYGLFLALQNNLGRLPRTHFLTATFPGEITYQCVRKHLRGVTRNLLYRAGFQSVDVVAFHPPAKSAGRLHVHLLVWSMVSRSPQAETKALEQVKAALNKGAYGVGSNRISTVEQFLDVAAYMAWNYDRTLKLAKGRHNPVPKGARVLSVPQEVLPGQRWKRTGKFSFVTPATTAWRRAIGRYAAATGRSTEGNWQWTWRERRHIREFLEPEQYRQPSFTGLDGYTYRVTPYGLDAAGNETYLISSEERGGFILTEHGLQTVGKFEAMSETLRKNDLLDLTTGEHACWMEVWGLPIPEWQERRNAARRSRTQPTAA